MDPIRLTFPVRTYDIDFAGIVSNIVYVRWLEDLRLELLARAYPLDRLVADGLGPVLLETRIAYRDALTVHDRPEGRMWVALIPSTPRATSTIRKRPGRASIAPSSSRRSWRRAATTSGSEPLAWCAVGNMRMRAPVLLRRGIDKAQAYR